MKPSSCIAAAAVPALVTLALVLSPLRAAQAQGMAAPITLDAALRLAVERSPALAAQRSAIAAAEQLPGFARELPDPKLTLGLEDLPVNGPDRFSLTRDSFTQFKVGVMQEFPRAEKRELKGQRAEYELARERAALDDGRAAVRRDTALAWFDLYYAQRMAAVVAQQVAETELQRDALRAGLRAGKTPAADLIGAEVGVQSLLDRQADFARQAARARAMLARWLGAEASRPLAPIDALAAPENTADVGAHVSFHPRIRALQQQIEVATADAALARASRKPDWSLEVSYAQRGPSYSNFVSVQVAVDLPLFLERRQDRDVAAKAALIGQAYALREDALRQHVADANAALADWDAAQRRAARFDQSILPLARERAQAALAAYGGGQGTLGAVLEARRALLDLSLSQLQLAADQARAYAQLLYFLPDEKTGENAK